MTDQILTQDRLKELLHYCPDTGIFTWKVKYSRCLNIGDIAGCLDKSNGYIKIGIDKKAYRAHRLAFLYMDGALPPRHVDHVNRIRNDNRWDNIRHATPMDNMKNRKGNNAFVGVHFNKKCKKWRAMMKGKCLGVYRTHLAACYARHYYEVSNSI